MMVKLNLDIDLAAWADQQGLTDSDGTFKITDARQDVRTFILNMIQQSASLEDAGTEATLA